MKNRLLLLPVLLVGLALAGCAVGNRPSPTPPALPTSAEPAATPTRRATPVPTATASAAAAANSSDQPAAQETAPPAVEESDIRSGKLLAATELRAAADASAAVLGEKPAGAIVVVTGASGDWYQIVSGLGSGGHAWLLKSAVTFELADPTATPTLSPTPEPTAAPAATGVAAAPVATVNAPGLGGTLVFQDAPGGSIYSMNADGSGLRRLTSGIEPALSPDGSQIAFGRWDEPRGLWLINADGSNERRVFEANRVRSPSWTADGQSVVFERAVRSMDCRISQFGCLSEDALQQVFGGEPCLTTPLGTFCISDYELVTKWFTALTRFQLSDGGSLDLPAPDEAIAPQTDPAGDAVIFLDPGGWSLTRSVGDGEPWPLVQDRSLVGVPSFSPDGTHIYTARKQHDRWGVWRWRSDGSQPTALTAAGPLAAAVVNNVAPAASPDGRSVAFLTDRSGRWELWVMDADGGNQRPLAPEALAGIDFRYDFNSDRVVDWGQ